MQPPTNNSTATNGTTHRSHRVSGVALFVLLVLLTVGLWQRQAIGDWFRLYGYHPSAAVTELADETTMTAAARHLFYINHPTIASKAAFAGDCTTQEKTIVLGCYHSDETGIYILNVSDKSQLGGVMEVTAAHEMLHAAYERLPAAERKTIDGELQDYYDHGLKDAAVKADIDAYKSSEPGQLLNEMHSIFGTEVAKLPQPLTAYYRRYFTDRLAVVQEAEKYQSAFRSREDAVKRYDTQLSRLKPTIQDDQSKLKSMSANLDEEKARLNQERASGQLSAYNAAVPTYNKAVNTYNALLAATKADIATYNDIVATRNGLVLEEQQLVKELSGDVPAAQP